MPGDAARFVRDRLWLGPPGQDPRADALMADWLRDNLAPDGDGWQVAAPAPQQALIWWEKSA